MLPIIMSDPARIQAAVMKACEPQKGRNEVAAERAAFRYISHPITFLILAFNRNVMIYVFHLTYVQVKLKY